MKRYMALLALLFAALTIPATTVAQTAKAKRPAATAVAPTQTDVQPDAQAEPVSAQANETPAQKQLEEQYTTLELQRQLLFEKLHALSEFQQYLEIVDKQGQLRSQWVSAGQQRTPQQGRSQQKPLPQPVTKTPTGPQGAPQPVTTPPAQ